MKVRTQRKPHGAGAAVMIVVCPVRINVLHFVVLYPQI